MSLIALMIVIHNYSHSTRLGGLVDVINNCRKSHSKLSLKSLMTVINIIHKNCMTFEALIEYCTILSVMSLMTVDYVVKH